MSLSRWFDVARARIRSLAMRGRVESELEKELCFHLEQQAEENRTRGMSSDEASHAARRRLGGVTQIEEECRDVRRVNLLDNLVQDGRYGMRMLGKNRMFTLIATLTLALGISINSTIFSLVSGWLLKKPVVADPDRVVAVLRANAKKHLDREWVPASTFLAWRQENHVFEKMTTTNPGEAFSLTGTPEPERLSGIRVSSQYFDVLGVKPLLGRTFLPGEDQAGRDHVVVLSHALWQRRFAADRQVIGKTTLLNGEKYLVIGVMPAGFRLKLFSTQLWVPLVFHPEELAPRPRNVGYYLVFARLKARVGLDEAHAEMDALAKRREQNEPASEKGWTTHVLTLQEFYIRWEGIRGGIALLMTAVALVLLIACVNVANLLLARGSSRQQEIAIRLALGAGRSRVIRQLLVESLLIAMLGGSAGLVFAYWGIDLLRGALQFNEDIKLLAGDVVMDHSVLVFAVLISMGTAILFGLGPAIRASANDPQSALRQGGRGGNLRRGRGRNALVCAEIALAVLLVIGAGLVTQATANELGGDYGYDPARVLTADLVLTNSRYRDPMRRVTLVRNVVDKLEALPGVETAGATSGLPFDAGKNTFTIRGKTILPAADRASARYFAVTPEYFRALGVPLAQGRAFRQSDTSRAPAVAMINQAFARRFFPGEQTIGRYIGIDTGDESAVPVWREIVGIVPDIKAQFSDPKEEDPQVYEPYLQAAPTGDLKFVVRAAGDPNALAPSLRAAIWSVDKDQPIGEIATVARRVREIQGGDVVVETLLVIFGAMALVLAGIGIYGVIAYAVAQRTHEIGIRMALGAQRAAVVRSVVMQGMLLAVVGAALGLAPSLALPKVFSALFQGWRVDGVPIFVGVPVLVLLVTLVAVLVPAVRAVRVDPMEALRHE
jgi:predicted permease